MSDTLARICADKREHIAEQQAIITLTDLERLAGEQSAPRGFLDALRSKAEAKETGLITEIKKASPSKGIIRDDFDPVSLAEAYVTGGATCLSVLTDTPYFQGADAYLQQVHAAVRLPLLRKDFMLEPYQIVESRALGADCILLIMAALEDAQARELEQVAFDYGMDVLVEVHDMDELERALIQLSSPLLGINNRNLKTLDVSLSTTETLAAHVPDSYTLVCESGIHSVEDIARMRALDIHCFLIGESLMRQADVSLATRALLA